MARSAAGSAQHAGGPGPEAEFLAFLEQGRFMIQRSRATGEYVFYPRVAVPGTGETDLEWLPASGGGRVHASTVNRSREGSYNIVLVDLDEGPRMMSRVEGVESVPIGTRVRARVARTDGAACVVFDVADAG